MGSSSNNYVEKIYDFAGQYRGDGATAIYSLDVVENILTSNTKAIITKGWNASAFQSQLGGITTNFTLYKQLEDGSWQKTNYSVSMDSFSREKTIDTKSVVVDKYDDEGNAIVYKWVETSIEQNGQEISITDVNGNPLTEEQLTDDEVSKYFTVEQSLVTGGEKIKVRYKSSGETTLDDNGQYSAVITNEIDDTTKAYLVKHWGGMEEGDSYPAITVHLVQTGNEGTKKSSDLTIEFKDDGTPIVKSGNVTLNGSTIYYKTNSTVTYDGTMYPVEFSNLPKYGKDGELLEYAIVENHVEGFGTSYSYKKDEDGVEYEEITNTKGDGKAVETNVKKYWLDDNDSTHRDGVKIKYYVVSWEESGSKDEVEVSERFEGTSYDAILQNSNDWLHTISTPYTTDEPMFDVIAVEVGIGSESISYSEDELLAVWKTQYYGASDDLNTQIAVNERLYEVMYAGSKQDPTTEKYVLPITNRRIGTADIHIEKQWVDGYTPTIRTDLQNTLDRHGYTLGYRIEGTDGNEYFVEINYTTGTSNVYNYVNGQLVKQEDGQATNADLIVNDLPKYDETGKVITYSTSEVVQIGNTYISLSKLTSDSTWGDFSEFKDYADSLSDVVFTPAVDDAKESDLYEYTSKNQLTDTKEVKFNIVWEDEYQQELGNRFDVYLDLYKEVYTLNDDGSVSVSLESVEKGRRWRIKDDIYTCSFGQLDEYDEYGNTIHYYAIQNTKVDKYAFDYIDAQYYDEQPTEDSEMKGTENEKDCTDDYVMPVDGKYAIKEDGYILNKIDNSVQLSGEKEWLSLPNGYEASDLPKAVFTITGTSRDADNEKKWIATYTIEKDGWDATEYAYSFEVLGENNISQEEKEGMTKLPRYDDMGYLIDYVISEEITYTYNDGNISEYTTDVTANDFNIKNTYDPSEMISLKLGKWLNLNKYTSNKPAVTFNIYRTYTGNDGEETEVTKYKSVTIHSNEFNQDGAYLYKELELNDLPKYAPNGSEYTYYVQEATLNGYTTTVNKKSNGTRTAYGEVTGENVQIQVNDGDYVTYKNDYTPDKTYVAWTKRWVDNGNASETRSMIAFTLTRSAAKQDSTVDNSIKESVEIEVEIPEEYEDSQSYSFELSDPFNDLTTNVVNVTISCDEDTLNTAEYLTITVGKDGDIYQLEKVATNGNAYTYTVEETRTPSQYKSDSKTYTLNTNASSINPKAATFTNSYETSVGLTKSWVGEDGTVPMNDSGQEVTVIANLYVQYSGSGWQKVTDGGNIKDALDAYAKRFGYQYEYEKSFRTYSRNYQMTQRTIVTENLPTILQVNNSKVEVSYVLVETAIIYDENTRFDLNPTIETNDDGTVSVTYTDTSKTNIFYPSQTTYTYKVANKDTITDEIGVTNTIENTYQKISIEVEKKYENDQDNKYLTRGNSSTNQTSKISFLLQRTTDGSTWTNVENPNTGKDYTVELSMPKATGTAVKGKISDLPLYTMIDGKKTQYTYRFVELNADGSIVSEDDDTTKGMYQSTYTMSETETKEDDILTLSSFTNTLETVNIDATKTFTNDDNDVSLKPVVLQLQYYNTSTKNWSAVVYYNNSKSVACNVTLNGVADTTTSDYMEDSAWHAVWNNVPKVYPNSATVDGETVYRVVEATSNYAYLDGITPNITSADVTEHTYHFDVSNTLTELKVEKSVFQPSLSQGDTTFKFSISNDSKNTENYSVVVFDKDGNVVSTSTVQLNTASSTFSLQDTQYAIVYGLPKNSTYTVKETNSSAWAVYNTSKDKTTNASQTITLPNTKSDSTPSATFYNVKVATLKFTKKAEVYTSDGWTEDQTLYNAQFVLKVKNDITQFDGTVLTGGQYIKKVNGVWTTVDLDSADHFTSAKTTGLVQIDGLPLGDYQIVEVEAPSAYYITTDPIDVTLKDNDQSKDGVITIVADDIYNEPYKYNVTVQKQSNDGKNLSGAVFELHASSDITQQNTGAVIYKKDALVQTVTTGSDGKATFKDLPYGTYYVKETKAPDGYEYINSALFTVVPQETSAKVEVKDGLDNVVVPETAQNPTVIVKDESIELSLVKAGEDGTSIEGYDYAVFKVDGKFSDGTTSKFVTNNASTKYKGETVVTMDSLNTGCQWIGNETYTFTEVYAPQGYTLADAFAVKVEYDGTLTKVSGAVTIDDTKVVMTIKDTKNSLDLKKTDGNIFLTGSVVKVTPSKTFADGSTTPKEITVDNDSIELVGILAAGFSYTIEEIKAPTGYALNTNKLVITLDENGKASITTEAAGYTLENNVVTLKNTPIGIRMNKYGDVDDEVISLDGEDAALFTIKGTFKDTETTTYENIKTTDMEQFDGKWYQSDENTKYVYSVTETYAPARFKIIDPFYFIVNVHGNVVITDESGNEKSEENVEAEGNTMNVTDPQTSVDISKVDITSREELEGATLQILDADENVLYEWQTDGSKHTIKGLTSEVTYTLHEKEAPEGYQLCEDTTFVLNRDGTIASSTTTTYEDNVLYVEDFETYTVEVKKVWDDGNDQDMYRPNTLDVFLVVDGEVTSQKITLTYKLGVEGGEWQGSFTNLDKYEYNEETGKYDQLVEYSVKEDEDMILEQYTDPETGEEVIVRLKDIYTKVIYSDPEITESDEIGQSKTSCVITNVHQPTPPGPPSGDTGSIQIIKQLTFEGKHVSAVDETFYVALFDSESLENRVSPIGAITFKNASQVTIEFNNLDIKKTYYVAEVDENGNPYSDTRPGTVKVDDKAYEFTPSFNWEEVTVTTDATVVMLENDFTELPPSYLYEATIEITKSVFDANGNASNSNETFYAGIFKDNELVDIVELKMDGKSSTTVSYTVKLENEDKPVTFTIEEVDKDGNKVSTITNFGYTVTYTYENKTRSQAYSVTLSPDDTAAVGIKNTKPKTPNTGVDTNQSSYMWAMTLSAFLMCVLVIKKKKEEMN